ncbi:MAG: hypothetical protein E6I73_08175 [Chloroflexi bacterium]|nr:MAG: hypothetical protein E6I73_08175 [Chloroflexota bacterium]
MRLTAAAGLCLLLAAGCVQVGPPGNPAANQTTSPPASSAASGPRYSQPPVTPPTAPGSNLPAFACADSGGGKTGVANVNSVRVSSQPDYDRFVLQFDGPVPTYTVKRQAKPTFPQGAGGGTITLGGTAGVLVRVHSATEANTYTGSTDLSHSEFRVLKEARLTEDFEGYVSWGLGLGQPACLRTFTLANPYRLVVDFTTATS